MSKYQFLKSFNGEEYVGLLSNSKYISTDKRIYSLEEISNRFKPTRLTSPELKQLLIMLVDTENARLKNQEKLEKVELEIQRLSNELVNMKKEKEEYEQENISFKLGKNHIREKIEKLLKRKKISVDEFKIVDMSFHNNTLDIPLAIAVLKANKQRPIYYRFGFGYKGAEKRRISKEDGIKILKEEKYFTDFRAEKSEILIQQYSDNDMF